MPYYIHDKTVTLPADEDERDRIVQGSCGHRADAFGVLKDRGWERKYTVTFLPSLDELYRWKYREETRFKGGEYIRVPWAGSELSAIEAIHYVHLSVDKPNMVAFTPDIEHGIIDKQTRMAPGRYLERFYKGVFTKPQIADYVAAIAAMFSTFGVATTVEDIRLVYRNGPPSCMGGPESHTGQYWRESNLEGHMPCEVYAAPSDLAVAYFGPKDKPAQRAVIWPERKIFSRDGDGNARVYGTGPLRQMLEAAGYAHGSFAGAKIRRIAVRNGVLMPYIDGSEYVDATDGNGFLVICDDEGDYSATSTQGVVWTGGRESAHAVDEDDDDNCRDCNHCGSAYDVDTEGSQHFCHSCCDEQWTCEVCGETGIGDDGQRYANEQTLCPACYADAHTTCADDRCSNRWIEMEEFSFRERGIRTHQGMTDLCRTCARDHYAYCESCDVVFDTRVTPTCEHCDREARCTRTPNLLADDTEETEFSSTTNSVTLMVGSTDDSIF